MKVQSEGRENCESWERVAIYVRMALHSLILRSTQIYHGLIYSSTREITHYVRLGVMNYWCLYDHQQTGY